MLQPDTVINFNAAKCIQSAAHFGYTEYINICNHTSSIVKWGGVDLVGFVFALAVGTLFLFALFVIYLKVVMDR